MTGGTRTVVAVVLAGGAGSRYATSRPTSSAGHKLDAALSATSSEPAETVAERAIRHVAVAAIGPIVVVVGHWTPRDEWAVEHPDVHVVVNADWQQGQITSVRAGVLAATARGADRVVIGLADQPFVSPDAWRTVAAGPGPICVATYGGRRGNPVALDASVWSMLPESGDEGARALMRIRPDLVREVACSGSPDDIDTYEDLHRWQNN